MTLQSALLQQVAGQAGTLMAGIKTFPGTLDHPKERIHYKTGHKLSCLIECLESCNNKKKDFEEE